MFIKSLSLGYRPLGYALFGWALILGVVILIETLVQSNIVLSDKFLFILPVSLFVSFILWGVSIFLGIKNLNKSIAVWASLSSALLGGTGLLLSVLLLLLSSAMP